MRVLRDEVKSFFSRLYSENFFWRSKLDGLDFLTLNEQNRAMLEKDSLRWRS